MLATLKCLTIPAMLLVLAGPILAGGTKYFINQSRGMVTVIMKAGDQTVTMEVYPEQQPLGAEYRANRVDSITFKSRYGRKTFKDEDGINANSWFTIRRANVLMTPERPPDKVINPTGK